MTATVRGLVARHGDLAFVLVAAVVGLVVPSPGRTLVDHHGIDVVLAILVFAAALTMPFGVGPSVRTAGRRLVAVSLFVSVGVLAAAWAASRFVDPGPLRLGVLAVGVAPVEIATVSLAPAGGADVLASAVLLMVSVVSTAVFAGPVLALLGGGARLHVGALVTNVLLVVVAPFAAGAGLRRRVPVPWRRGAPAVASIAVTVLVWLVASTARLSTAYILVVVALAFVIGAGAALGSVARRFFDAGTARSVVFAASMRDFAIAAGVVSAAFGSHAAGPLGLYGIMVMVWGTGLAGVLRRRPAAR